MTPCLPECILKVFLATPDKTKILDTHVLCMGTGEDCLFQFHINQGEWKFIFISAVHARGKKLVLLTALH